MGADVLRCGTYSSRAALFQANTVVQIGKTLFTSQLRSIVFGSEYRSLQDFLYLFLQSFEQYGTSHISSVPTCSKGREHYPLDKSLFTKLVSLDSDLFKRCMALSTGNLDLMFY